MAHQNSSFQFQGVHQVQNQAGVIGDGLQRFRRPAFTPSRQLGQVGQGGGAQGHVTGFPLAGSAHTVKVQHRVDALVGSAYQAGNVEPASLHCLAVENGPVSGSHKPTSLASPRLRCKTPRRSGRFVPPELDAFKFEVRFVSFWIRQRGPLGKSDPEANHVVPPYSARFCTARAAPGARWSAIPTKSL